MAVISQDQIKYYSFLDICFDDDPVKACDWMLDWWRSGIMHYSPLSCGPHWQEIYSLNVSHWLPRWCVGGSQHTWNSCVRVIKLKPQLMKTLRDHLKHRFFCVFLCLRVLSMSFILCIILLLHKLVSLWSSRFLILFSDIYFTILNKKHNLVMVCM